MSKRRALAGGVVYVPSFDPQDVDGDKYKSSKPMRPRSFNKGAIDNSGKPSASSKTGRRRQHVA